MRGMVIKLSIYKNQTKTYKHFYTTNTNMYSVICECSQARSKAPDLNSGLVAIQGFESLRSHFSSDDS